MTPTVMLPSSESGELTLSERSVRRVLDIDAGLRALIDSGSKSEVDFQRNFGSSAHLAPVLAEQHLVFYNPATKGVQFESTALRQVVIGVLDSAPHKARIDLARTLLQWQQASAIASECWKRPRSAWGFIADAAWGGAEFCSEAQGASLRVAEVAATIQQLRLRL